MENRKELNTSKERKSTDTRKKKYVPPKLTTYGKKEDLGKLGKEELPGLFEEHPTN
jgi:hypothetical protein